MEMWPWDGKSLGGCLAVATLAIPALGVVVTADPLISLIDTAASAVFHLLTTRGIVEDNGGCV
jgi:hypothetical protein